MGIPLRGTGEPWTQRDDLLLRLMLELRYPLDEIVEALDRSASAIETYRRKMGYDSRGQRK